MTNTTLLRRTACAALAAGISLTIGAVVAEPLWRAGGGGVRPDLSGARTRLQAVRAARGDLSDGNARFDRLVEAARVGSEMPEEVRAHLRTAASARAREAAGGPQGDVDRALDAAFGALDAADRAAAPPAWLASLPYGGTALTALAALAALGSASAHRRELRRVAAVVSPGQPEPTDLAAAVREAVYAERVRALRAAAPARRVAETIAEPAELQRPVATAAGTTPATAAPQRPAPACPPGIDISIPAILYDPPAEPSPAAESRLDADY